MTRVANCNDTHRRFNGFIFEFRDSTLRVASASIIIDGKERKARVRRLDCGCCVIGTLRETKAEVRAMVNEIRIKEKKSKKKR